MFHCRRRTDQPQTIGWASDLQKKKPAALATGFAHIEIYGTWLNAGSFVMSLKITSTANTTSSTKATW